MTPFHLAIFHPFANRKTPHKQPRKGRITRLGMLLSYFLLVKITTKIKKQFSIFHIAIKLITIHFYMHLTFRLAALDSRTSCAEFHPSVSYIDCYALFSSNFLIVFLNVKEKISYAFVILQFFPFCNSSINRFPDFCNK